MKIHKNPVACLALVLGIGLAAGAERASAQAGQTVAPKPPTIQQYLGAAWPLELVSAKKPALVVIG